MTVKDAIEFLKSFHNEQELELVFSVYDEQLDDYKYLPLIPSYNIARIIDGKYVLNGKPENALVIDTE